MPILILLYKYEIEKILINYLQNAYKHVSSFGTISIIIKEEGEYVYIGVNNDGLQIPEEEIPNIWNKFYKIDKSHKSLSFLIFVFVIL